MSNDTYIFEATTANFDQIVLQNSNKIPVIALFMGVWSEPCFALTEIFSKLAKEFSGQFIFSKIDIDEQPDLKERFDIVNVPTIITIQKGKATSKTEGLLTEDEARALLKGVDVFNAVDALRQQARELHINGDTNSAVLLLSDAIKQDPRNTSVALDMVQIFIDIKETEQANGLFNKLPETAKKTPMGKSITGQLTFINLAADKQDVNTLKGILLRDEFEKSARFDLAICLTAIYEYDEAIDNLLTLHQQDPNYNNAAAKELAMTLINMLKESRPEIASRAQQRLSNLIIS